MTGRSKQNDDWMRCPACGKRGYHSRKTARKAMRGIHPGDSRMRPYACDGENGLWHFGHLPDVVKKRGLYAADVVFADRKRRRGA